MPVEMRMWRIDGDEPRALTASALPAEKDLHEFLKRDPSLLGERLLVIGSEVITPFGPRLDLLAIDAAFPPPHRNTNRPPSWRANCAASTGSRCWKRGD